MTKDSTDSRLLDVAVDHFGRLGLSGAATRAIAKDADTPMSSITYHFGGKDGLYLAAADHIAAQVRVWLNPAILEASAICGPDGTRNDARAALHIIIGHIAEIMMAKKTAAIARFIVREQAEPTEAFHRIFDGVMHPMLTRISGLVRLIAGGRIDEEEAKLRAMTLIGQVLFFRVARAAVLKGLAWDSIGDEQVKAVKRILAFNLDAIFDRLQAEDEA